MSLVARRLEIEFTLSKDNPGGSSFGQGGANTLRLKDVRISAKVVKAGGATMGAMSASVYGMTLKSMNQLSTLGMRIQFVPRNTAALFAGDADGNMKLVYKGTVTQAYADMNAAPEVAFQVQCQTGAAEAVTAIPPTSYKGGVDVAEVMKTLAGQMGLGFENNDVSVQLADPYFAGSARQQAEQVANQAGISWVIDNGTLIIWPKNKARKTAKRFILMPGTGLIGYPAYTAQGIMVKNLFNPAIQFGSEIEVQSDLKPACGVWAVYGIEHDLDAIVPNGRWQSTLQCFDPNFAPPLVR